MADEAKEVRKRRNRSNRRKGKVYEREVAEVCREFWPGARRGIGQARSAGEVPDVTGTPFWIEAKHRRQLNLLGALDQATHGLDVYRRLHGTDRCPYRFPVVVARLDTREAFGTRTDVVVVRLADVLDALRDAWQAGAAGRSVPPVDPAGRVPGAS